MIKYLQFKPQNLYIDERVPLSSYLFLTGVYFLKEQSLGYRYINSQDQSRLLPNQGIFNLPHHIGMASEELAFDDGVSYTQWRNGLQYS